MTQEDYVSFEVAKLLKEKGYNTHQKQHYFIEDVSACDGVFVVKKGVLTEMFHLSDEFDEFKVYAPSLYYAQKWLREEHDVIVIPRYDLEEETDKPLGYSYDIFINAKFKTFSMGFDTYEQALNEGIKEALKMI